MHDYVPRNDAEFNIWQSNLISILTPNTDVWGFPADDFSALLALQTTWNTVFAKASSKSNRTYADVQAKDDTRKTYETGIRQFLKQWIMFNSKVSDSERERMGLTIRKETRSPAPVPATSPVGVIDFSVRLRHSISFSDKETQNSKAKPKGVHGCEIWMKLENDSDFRYHGTDTRTPYIVSFDLDQAKTEVQYRLRWVNTRGEYGPWSSILSAVVPG